jgi:hypothetical protein
MLKNWLKQIFLISLELLLISGALWFVAQKRGIEKPSEIIPALQKATTEIENKVVEKSFPAPAEQSVHNFSWEYQGAKYSLKETLYQSSYDYYHSQPKGYSYVGPLSANWEEDYYGMFLKTNPQDQTISQLAKDLQDLGARHKLTSDQLVDLTMAFVQAIPYDDAKAKQILAQAGNVGMRYPYEVLFENLGVCSDKSLLATAILRQMGYGVAIFAYEQDNHMAIGIECPKNYSTYGSGYCFAETTASGNKVGVIPTFDANSNKTVGAVQLSNLDQNQQTKLQQLGQVTIFQKTSGKQYSGIIATSKILAEIETLKKSIASQFSNIQIAQKNLKNQQGNLESTKKELDAYQKAQNIEKFNSLVEKYNSLLEDYQNDVKKFNNNVTLYNQAIKMYNTLIQ